MSKLGDGIRTVAFAVDGPKATAEALDAKRVRKIGGAFIHPVVANGVLVQMSQQTST